MLEPQEPQLVPSTERLAILTALVDTTGPLYHPNLHLYKNAALVTAQIALGDLDEADFDGYAKVTAMVWSSPYYDVDGTALVMGADHVFLATGATTPNTIYGWYLTDSTDAELLAVGVFNDPVGIAAAGQAVPTVPFFRYSGN